MVDVPFRPMDDHFVTILMFFAIFVGRRVPFFGHSLLSYSKRRHVSTSRVIPLIDCHQSLYFPHRTLSTFLPDLCFIWQSHRFQFLGCALSIGFWQLRVNLQRAPTRDGTPRVSNEYFFWKFFQFYRTLTQFSKNKFRWPLGSLCPRLDQQTK